jgi:hypothetical protein
MAKINDYYQKRELMDQLSHELKELEKDEALKTELKFEEEVKALMDSHDKTPQDIVQILIAIDPTISTGPKAGGSRAKRPLQTYKNPHTGEVVKTRGGNHKTLNEWRKQHGKEAVQSWAS